MQAGERLKQIAERIVDPNFSERRSLRNRLGKILGEETERSFTLNNFPGFDFEGVWSYPEGVITGVSVGQISEENGEKVFSLTLETEESGIGIELRSNSISPFVLVKPGTTREIPGMSIKNMSEIERVLLEFGNMIVGLVSAQNPQDKKVPSLVTAPLSS